MDQDRASPRPPGSHPQGPFQGAVAFLQALVAGEPDGLRAWLAAHRLDIDAAAWLCAQGLAPYVFHRLRKEGLESLVATQIWTSLRNECLRVAGQNLLAHAAAGEWARRFAADGITAVWLKGIPLSLTVYPDSSLRPMGDIDLLVRRRQLPQVLALLRLATGHEPATLAEDSAMHAVVQVGQAELIKMEVHWSLIDAPISSLAGDVEWFLEQQQAISGDGVGLLTLRPEAHLLYLCAHAEIAHGEGQFRLLRYLDLHLLIDQTPGLDWQIVVNQAVVFGWTYAVERALGITQRWFATRLPEHLLAELRARRPNHEDVSAVLRRQVPANRWEGTLNRFASMNWSARLRLAGQLIFPPPAYMRWRYRTKQPWRVVLCYPYRWWDVASEIFRTAWKRLGF
jgi:hypothetical protein